MTRHLDIYRTERRIAERVYVLAWVVTRRAVLTRYWLGDARRRIGRAR